MCGVARDLSQPWGLLQGGSALNRPAGPLEGGERGWARPVPREGLSPLLAGTAEGGAVAQSLRLELSLLSGRPRACALCLRGN